MYNLTQDELAIWQKPYAQACSIVGEGLSITEKDICVGGFVIDRRSVSRGKIEIGSVISAQMNLTIDNHDGRWDDIALEGKSVSVSISSTKPDRWFPQTSIVQMGYFVIDSVDRKKTRIPIIAYDRMMQFDRMYTDGITFPATPANIVLACCNKCDVPCSIDDFSSFNNYNTVIEETDMSKRTYREILSYALEIMGVCGWCDWNGEFVCGWYKQIDGNPLIVSEHNRMSSVLGERVVITGIQIDDTLYVVPGGGDDYVINIEGNPFITDDNRDSIGSVLASSITGFEYYIADSSIKPAPHIWPLDMLEFTRGDENYSIIVSGMTFKLNGNTEIASDGVTAQTESYASANPLTKAESVIIKNIERAQSNLGAKVTELSRVNDIASNALGFHTTLEEQADGSLIEYTHDKSELENSHIIYKKTSAGFFLSQDGGQTYTSGYDSDGNAYLNILSVNGVKADWLTAGILKDRTGGQNFWLNLDTGELKIGDGELHYMQDSQGRGILSLGDEGSVHITLDNDSVDLVDGDRVLASFSASVSQMPRVRVTEYLHVGEDWEISRSATGGLSIRWIGG